MDSFDFVKKYYIYFDFRYWLVESNWCYTQNKQRCYYLMFHKHFTGCNFKVAQVVQKDFFDSLIEMRFFTRGTEVDQFIW